MIATISENSARACFIELFIFFLMMYLQRFNFLLWSTSRETDIEGNIFTNYHTFDDDLLVLNGDIQYFNYAII